MVINESETSNDSNRSFSNSNKIVTKWESSEFSVVRTTRGFSFPPVLSVISSPKKNGWIPTARKRTFFKVGRRSWRTMSPNFAEGSICNDWSLMIVYSSVPPPVSTQSTVRAKSADSLSGWLHSRHTTWSNGSHIIWTDSVNELDSVSLCGICINIFQQFRFKMRMSSISSEKSSGVT